MESNAKQSPFEVQDGLVREYCRKAETLIAVASSQTEAIRIKEEQCQKFQTECKSTLVANAVAAYLDQVITQQYGTNRTNDAH